MKIKTKVKKTIYGYRADSESYVSWLREKGVEVGNGTRIIDPKTCWIDVTRPWMVRIGENVTITPGVNILTHDYSWSIITGKNGKMFGRCGHVFIGDNVFIGENTTILGRVDIGNNVIIGANSLVKKSILDDTVVGGNPAQVLCSLEEYELKCEKRFVDDAMDMAICYYNRYSIWPPVEIFYEHFWIFEKNYGSLIPMFKNVFNWVRETKEKSIAQFRTYQHPFDSYEDFIEECKKKRENENETPKCYSPSL